MPTKTWSLSSSQSVCMYGTSSLQPYLKQSIHPSKSHCAARTNVKMRLCRIQDSHCVVRFVHAQVSVVVPFFLCLGYLVSNRLLSFLPITAPVSCTIFAQSTNCMFPLARPVCRMFAVDTCKSFPFFFAFVLFAILRHHQYC